MAIRGALGTAATTIDLDDLVGRRGDRETFPTDPDITATFRKVVSVIQRFIRTHPNIEGIGVCVPGLVDPETEIPLFIPHFKWRNWSVASELTRITGLPVTVDNDANAA